MDNKNDLLMRKLNAMLELRRDVVGIQLFSCEEDYKSFKARELKNKIPYCVMIKAASKGHAFKANIDNFGCTGAARALGIIEPGEDYYEGHQAFNFNTFADISLAKKTIEDTVIIKQKVYGVYIASLDKCEIEPDVVIVFTDTFGGMRLVHAHNYHYGSSTRFQINGNQALCAELTAFPYEMKDMNISLMCSGTRQNCDWGNGEVGIGIPYSMLANVVDGLLKTINPLERDKRKKQIVHNLKDYEREFEDKVDFAVEYGKNYDTGLYIFGTKRR